MTLEEKLEKRKKIGNLRKLKLYPSLIDFCSNDYLGLARSSKLATSSIKELKKQTTHLTGIGSTGSRLLTGNSQYAQALEEKIAHFHGYKTGVLFSCGYMANLGLLSIHSEELIIFDAKVHASTRDGIRLSRAKSFPFKHNDLEHLENRLKKCSKNCLICIESIYSTGSKAPLIEICLLAKKYGAKLIVDEAHAVGVYGPNGRGLLAEYNLTSSVFAQVTTFGKALGTYGAIILCDPLLKQALINFATSYIYTTALPLQTLAAIKSSYDLFPTLETQRKHLQYLRQIFHKSFPNFSTHIFSHIFKGNRAVKQAAQKLSSQGFDVRALLSPTVQQKEECLRICLHAFNTEDEVVTLITHLKAL